MVKNNNHHLTETPNKESVNQTQKSRSKRKQSIRKTKEATKLEDVYNEIYNLVNKMTIVAAGLDEREHSSKINQFFGCNPPSFGQNTDPVLATDWIYVVDSIFDLIRCSDEQKVSFAVLGLKDDALSWWKMEQRDLETDGIPVTWLKFKTLFYERYFPRWLQLEKYVELCNMVQGNRTVAQYDAEFTKLYCLVHEYISDDDVVKAALFERGLRQEIRLKLCFFNDMSYPELRTSALRLEQRLDARED